MTKNNTKIKLKKTNQDVDRVIGARVRRARVELGMSQENLGLELGLTFQQVQKYEKGINRISVSTMLNISRILGKPLSFFVDHPDSAPVLTECDKLLGIPDGRDLVNVVSGFSRSSLKTLVEVASAMRKAGAGA